VELVEKILSIFCSTYQLDVQEKAANVLLEITYQSLLCVLFTYLSSTNNDYPDQLHSILISKIYFTQLLNASLSGDALLQSLALEIILSLTKSGELLLLLVCRILYIY